MKLILVLLFLVCCSACSTVTVPAPVLVHVDVKKQQLQVTRSKITKVYPVSTSKFGLGDFKRSYATPTGWLQVAQKFGDNYPVGAVFRHCRWTGEICPPNTPGRDPIITRVICLRGLEKCNAHAYNRGIFVHGTPEEKYIGRPASYGCVRMRSKDIIDLYNLLPVGSLVQIQ